MMEEEGGESKQAASSSLHNSATSQQGHPAQKPRDVLTVPIRMLSPWGQQCEGMQTCLGLALVQPPEPPPQAGGASPSPSLPASLPGRGLAARLPGSIFS